MTGCRTSRVAWPALPLLACGLLLPSGVSAWPVHAGAEFRVNTTIQGAQASPSVASDAAGNFVVVWDTHIAQPPETYEQWVRGQRYGADGMPIGGEFQINASTLGSNETPAVAMDPGGPFVVAWARGDLVTGDWSIWVRRFDASGAPLGLESQASSTSGDLRVPGIAALPGGGFVVVWQGFGAGDPDGYGIFARIFDVTGTPVTGDFVVNTYTTDYQWYPSVASAPTGDFVVVWERSFKSVLAARR